MDDIVAKKKIASVGSVALKGMLAGAAKRQDSVAPDPRWKADTEEIAAPVILPPRSPDLPRATDIPKPPFLGVRTLRNDRWRKCSRT